MNDLKNLPGIDKLLSLSKIKICINEYGRDLTTYSLRTVISKYRNNIKTGEIPPSIDEIVKQAEKKINDIVDGSLKSIVNATGIIIHTNLGRAPLGKELVNESSELLISYSNLEYNLEKGIRSDRNNHASELIKFITGAEDVLIVNNNAAAVLLILCTLAKDKEVIVSRGELIEIGGSFRIPDIMAASACKMVEIGTTNKTRINDYSNSINENTALLFKAHRSNFKIRGFTEEVKLEELVKLGKKYDIPVIYDMGSGLLKKSSIPALINEPDVKQVLLSGVDLVCFSGDKLLGGPQAGIITGSSQMINKLKKEPMMRALRVCKLTLAFLENACKYYISDSHLNEKNIIFKTLRKSKEELKANSELLNQQLTKHHINSKVIVSKGQFGGGSMPDTTINSFAVRIEERFNSRKKSSAFTENMFMELLNLDKPVVGVLKQGKIHFDVLTLFEDEILYVAKAINEVYEKIQKTNNLY